MKELRLFRFSNPAKSNALLVSSHFKMLHSADVFGVMQLNEKLLTTWCETSVVESFFTFNNFHREKDMIISQLRTSALYF